MLVRLIYWNGSAPPLPYHHDVTRTRCAHLIYSSKWQFTVTVGRASFKNGISNDDIGVYPTLRREWHRDEDIGVSYARLLPFGRRPTVVR